MAESSAMDSTPTLALFVYKRLDHTRRTLESLALNRGAVDLNVVIFSDGPRTEKDEPAVAAVREFCRKFRGFKALRIQESKHNRGLACSITSGVSQVLSDEDSVMVLEDDMVTSPAFLTYMMSSLARYRNEERVASIHAYCYPIKGLPPSFFLRGADCWGWGTWRRAWSHFSEDSSALLSALEAKRLTYQFDYEGTYPYTQMLRDQLAGRVDSWAIRWYASAFLKEMLTLYPGMSFIENIGLDGSGTHLDQTAKFTGNLSLDWAPGWPAKIDEDACARRLFSRYFLQQKPPHQRVLHRLKAFINSESR
jgi:hypothetical protein